MFTKRKICRGILILFAVVLALSFTACGSEEKVIKLKESNTTFNTAPCLNNGKPFKIALVDEYPAIESSYLWLKGMIEQFQTMGYINQTLDLSDAPEDYEGFYEYLMDQELGGYIEFDEQLYYVDSSGDNDQLTADLSKKIDSGEIDLIASTGTTPGLYLKEQNFGIPFLVCMASDPVDSGIIDSAEDTGDENIWALVEPNPLERQYKAYHDLFNFTNFGILYLKEYEDILFLSSYDTISEEMGIKVTKDWVTEADWERSDYVDILRNKVKGLINKGIDAFMISIAVLPDDDASVITDILEEENIPCLVTDGNNIVKTGGLLCLGCYDYEGYGKMASMVMSDIFHGEKAGDQPCVYVSSPVLAFNISSAQRIGMTKDFAFLQTLDFVYKDEQK